jgi:hypothetical protein
VRGIRDGEEYEFSDAARDKGLDGYAAGDAQRCLMQLKRDVLEL